MEELVIKRHSFEKSKAEIKKFSEQTTTDLDLRRVNSSKDVGEWFSEWFMGGGIGRDHKVTGSELNSLTTQIQENFINVNNTQRKLITEFGQVYSALEALDKDYIQAILLSIEATRKTNNKLQESQKVIKENQDNIEEAQQKIEKEGKLLQKTVKALQQFKEKLDTYKHIADIDKMWNDIQNYAKEIASYQNAVSELEKFRSNLEENEHLLDIDLMWRNIEDNKSVIKKMGKSIYETDQIIKDIESTIKKIEDRLENQDKKIAELKNTQDKISEQTHILDIDQMWDNANSIKESVEKLTSKNKEVQDSIKKQDTLIEELVQKKKEFDAIVHLKEVDDLFDNVEICKSDIIKLKEKNVFQEEKNNELEKVLKSVNLQMTEMKADFSRKIKIAYVVAGSTMGIAIIELILILARIV